MSVVLVTYNGQKIVPAPFLTWQKNPTRGANGEKFGKSFTITISNKMLTNRGSPDSDGDFDTSTSSYPADETVSLDARLASAQRKQEALRKLFSVDGQKLAWKSASGDQEVYCYPIVTNIDIPEGSWVQYFEYTITFQANELYGDASLADESFAEQIESATESWSINPDPSPGIFTLSHSISAQGKLEYVNGVIPTGAWVYAKYYVNKKKGYDYNVVASSLLWGALDSSTYSPYNYVVEDSIDELNGSYSLTENWVLATGAYREDYTTSLSYLANDPNKTATLSIQGNIRGFYSGLNQQYIGFANAQSAWSTIKSQIPTRATDRLAGAIFTNANIDENPAQATITYNYNYENLSNVSGNATDEFTVTRRHAFEDYRTTVSIDGNVQGLIGPEEVYSLKYERALNRFAQIQPLLYSRAIQYASGVENLKATPVSRNVVDNPVGGNISYSYEYNNRLNDLYNDEFNVSFNFDRSQGINTVSVQGTIQGYGASQTGNYGERYANALAALPSDSELFARAQNFSSVYIVNRTINKEIVHAEGAGTITYQATFNNEPSGLIEGAISETWSVSDTNSVHIIPQIAVLGRLKGPILQLVNSKTSRVRNINVEYVLAPPTGVYSISSLYNGQLDVWEYISGIVPTASRTYLIEDNNTVNFPNNYRGGRSVAYLWEPD